MEGIAVSILLVVARIVSSNITSRPQNLDENADSIESYVNVSKEQRCDDLRAFLSEPAQNMTTYLARFVGLTLESEDTVESLVATLRSCGFSPASTSYSLSALPMDA